MRTSEVMMAYYCSKCRTEIPEDEAKRLPFSALCDRCSNDLHSCFHCHFHDRSAYNECRESQADRVVDKEKRNRCEYFKFRSGPAGQGPIDRPDPKAKLDDLFKKSDVEEGTPAKNPSDALDDIFKK